MNNNGNNNKGGDQTEICGNQADNLSRAVMHNMVVLITQLRKFKFWGKTKKHIMEIGLLNEITNAKCQRNNLSDIATHLYTITRHRFRNFITNIKK